MQSCRPHVCKRQFQSRRPSGCDAVTIPPGAEHDEPQKACRSAGQSLPKGRHLHRICTVVQTVGVLVWVVFGVGYTYFEAWDWLGRVGSKGAGVLR
jgi:hypothetical protein